MLLKNGSVFTGSGFSLLDIQIDADQLVQVEKEIRPKAGESVYDLDGAKVIPGLIDIHTHGCAMRDFCDGSEESFDILAENYIKNGITTVCPTSMTLPPEQLETIYTAFAHWSERPHRGSRLIGINMEGPFLSVKKRGAHRAEYVIPASEEIFDRLWKASGGRIRLCDVAPEISGNLDFIRYAKAFCTVSVAHTAADYDGAIAGYHAGATSTTHLFNAMNGLAHRAPGTVGAAFDSGAYAELICDGEHVLPPVLRAAFSMFGDRIAIISDSLMAAGMPEGTECVLGDEAVVVRGGKAVLPDGTIAGSIVNILEEIRRLISFGIDEAQAIRCSTITPARIIGEEKSLGSIEKGKLADLVVLKEDYTPKAVFRDGTIEFGSLD